MTHAHFEGITLIRVAPNDVAIINDEVLTQWYRPAVVDGVLVAEDEEGRFPVPGELSEFLGELVAAATSFGVTGCDSCYGRGFQCFTCPDCGR